MKLTKAALKYIAAREGLSIPDPSLFDLPEKVLQFGTGVLLRGLPDYFIDKANRSGLFNGRIVMVKSTDAGGTDAFQEQDGLYTHCVKGIENGQPIEETIINSSISRVISAKNNWSSVLACASDPGIRIVISNTTEVGITLVNEDIKQGTPSSFPGKLLAFLYERYQKLGSTSNAGLVIVPTELIIDNGSKLKSILLELSKMNMLGDPFIDWLANKNHFCNSLVDRIVPGALPEKEKLETTDKLGYTDDLMIMSEPFRLWAIESNEPEVKRILSFAQADAGVVIAPSIEKFRELKLRLLNGTHTFTCGLAFLAGFDTVKQGMRDPSLSHFVKELMLNEIGPAMESPEISREETESFARSVVERFQNPYLEHQWLAITMQYSSKMKMRNLPLILAHYKKHDTVPELMAKGFAAFILFMKGSEQNPYPVRDENATLFAEKWKMLGSSGITEAILGDISLWGQDLCQLPGFRVAVKEWLIAMETNGANNILERKIGTKPINA